MVTARKTNKRKKGKLRKEVGKAYADYSKRFNESRESIRHIRYNFHSLGCRADYTLDRAKIYGYGIGGAALTTASAVGIYAKNDKDLGDKVTEAVEEVRENSVVNQIAEFAVDNPGYGLVMGALLLWRASAASFRREFVSVKKYKPKYTK